MTVLAVQTRPTLTLVVASSEEAEGLHAKMRQESLERINGALNNPLRVNGHSLNDWSIPIESLPSERYWRYSAQKRIAHYNEREVPKLELTRFNGELKWVRWW